MTNQAGAKLARVKRVIVKQIVWGDFRKFEARSNDAPTGGGARDLRFRPHDKFAEVFRLLFPDSRTETRRREGENLDVEVLVGRLHWSEAGRDVSAEATFETPTTSRAGEGRMPMVYRYPPFNRIVEEWPEDKWEADKKSLQREGRLVLLLVQRDDGSVWPEFATEESLRSDEWEDSIARPILGSLSARRGSNQVARGYIDLVSGREYFW